MLPNNGHVPGNVSCAGPPDWPKSSLTPGQSAPAALEVLATKIASLSQLVTRASVPVTALPVVASTGVTVTAVP